MSAARRRAPHERVHRFSLTLFLTSIVFLVLLLALGISSVSVYLLVRVGLIGANDGAGLGETLLAVSLASLLVGAGLTILLGKFPMNPFHKLILGLKRLAAGRFSTRIAFHGPARRLPVFTEIEQSFNSLATELENTELLRSGFINDFSHEFRTPIASIAGFAELLEGEDLTEEERRQYVAIIKEESRRLSRMAQSVLDLSRVERQTILTDATRYNLSEQMRSCLLLLEERWTEKELCVEMELCEHEITANEELMRQVLINLFDNAVKFADHGGRIGATVTEEEDLCRIEVFNTGEPIPQEKQSHIFNKFY